MELIKGKVWKLGDNINTDVIAPGKYLKLTNQEQAQHVFEGIDPEFPSKIKPGDIVVGGENFGSGSSRESAPAAIKYAGVSAVVSVFFARIFFRNAINLGLPVLECPEANNIQQGDKIEINLQDGLIRNITQNKIYKASRLPEHIQELVSIGGLVPYLEQQLRQK